MAKEKPPKQKYFECKNDGCDNICPPPRLAAPKKNKAGVPQTQWKRSWIHYAQCHACSNLISNYGITNGERMKMFEDCGGVCEICNEDMIIIEQGANPNLREKRNAAIDHNHSKEKGDPNFVRGLICSQCNRAMGLLNDDLEAIKRLVKYLQRNK